MAIAHSVTNMRQIALQEGGCVGMVFALSGEHIPFVNAAMRPFVPSSPARSQPKHSSEEDAAFDDLVWAVPQGVARATGHLRVLSVRMRSAGHSEYKSSLPRRA